MPGKCKFNDLWLDSQDLAKWLSPVSNDIYKAYCKVCKSRFDISHGGMNSIAIHAKGKKHITLINALVNGAQKTICFKSLENQKDSTANKVNETNEVVDSATKEVVNKDSQSVVMKSFVIREQVTRAEILWALHTTLSHSSSRSGGNASDLFKRMFPDSLIAESFRMHKDKLSYVITYGLGPYFQNLLVNDLRKSDFFSFSFDESLNKVAQKSQMDILVRFWNNSENLVNTRYLSSMFLGHGSAVDLLEAFTTTCHKFGLPLSKVIQIETDGPNVNLKFLRDFDEHMKNEEGCTRLDIGTCSLHVLHGCYKTALKKSEWAVNDFLRAAYFLFKDFPSRRADYKHFSGSSMFPLKLCAIRWVENSRVIQRAIAILPFLKTYIEAVKNHPPATRNFELVSSFLKDKLLMAKLHFLQSIASELETFLILFQSEKPLVPHLYEELSSVFKNLGSRFLKSEVLSSKNLRDILLINLELKDNQLAIKKIDVGFGASTALTEASENEKIIFRRECRDFLANMLTKLKVKSPLCKSLVKGVSCLSPQVMLSSDSIKSNRISNALKEFIEKKHITPIEADCAKSTYLKICQDPVVRGKLQGYNIKKDRLDEFFMDILSAVEDTNPLVFFVKKVLTMFHGNAAVERSFSINKNCLIENLEENSLISQRCVHSAILKSGGIENISITKDMIKAVLCSSAKRNEALKQNKLKQDSEEHAKKMAAAEINEMKKRKIQIMQMAQEEVEELDKKILLTEKKMKKC